MCTNARRVNNKIPELNHMLSINSIDLACATESWLGNYVTNFVILLADRFTIYRKDRDTRGGEICLIIRKMSSSSSHQVSLPAKFLPIQILCVDLYVRACCGV